MPPQIVLKVFEWLRHTLAHGFESGKVNNCGNLVAMDQALNQLHIGHTALLALRYLASNAMQAR
jgi:hypothetical protein